MNQTLRKILYVEDEDDIRTIFQLALETVGSVVHKSCAGGAQPICEGPDFAPDLILLDVMMPGMDGPSTLGSLDVIAKLFDPMTLADQVRAIWGRAHG